MPCHAVLDAICLSKIQQPMFTMECISRTVRPEELFLFQSRQKKDNIAQKLLSVRLK